MQEVNDLDKVSVQRIAKLHPKLKDEAFNILVEINNRLTSNVICRYTSTFRSSDEQDALFEIGRTKKGRIVTMSRGGFSYHNYGLAIDIALIDGKNLSYDVLRDYDDDGHSDWMEIVQVFKEYGWEWGGNWKFKDLPHFQKTFGYSIKQLLRIQKDTNGYPVI